MTGDAVFPRAIAQRGAVDRIGERAMIAEK